MFRASIHRILVLIFLLIPLPACTSETPQPDLEIAFSDSIVNTPTRPPVFTPYPTEEIIRGTVSIRHSWNEIQLPLLAQIIKHFQSYYPDVMFDVLYVPAEILYDKYASDTREGIGPTLLLGPAEWGPQLYNEGLIADITEYFDNNLLVSLNQPALGLAQINSRLVGLPYTIQGVVLYRNKDVITIKPNTFDDFVTLAQTSSQGAVLGAYLERSFFYSGAHLNGLGGQLVDINNMPGFNNGKGVQWLELLKELEQAGPTCFHTDDDLDRFKAGTVGWIIDGTWSLPDLVTSLGAEKLAIDPWPTYQGGHLSGYVRSENIFLNAHAKNDDLHAAIKFMGFLVSSEAQTQFLQAGLIPSSIQVYPGDNPQAEIIQQAIQALANGTGYPLIPEMQVYRDQFDITLRAYFDQNLPPEQTLQAAQDAILSQLPGPLTAP